MIVTRFGKVPKHLLLLTAIATLAGYGLNSKPRAATAADKPYRPTWNSLTINRTPQWLQDGKLGIYTRWGVYSVPAVFPNGTWYSDNMYMNLNSPARIHQETIYGPLEKFGCKDFIPMFTGEKFNADERAGLFQKAGARFAGPVAEHRDGFSVWDTRYSKWNAAKMGPKQDVVGQLSKAIKLRNVKFVVAFHHAQNWFFFSTWDKRYDCGDPRYSGLYGPIHEKGVQPGKEFLDDWESKILEVIDKYDPDFICFDFGLRFVNEDYRKDVLAYYFNNPAAENKEVVVTYKDHDLPAGVGINDLNCGRNAN